MRRITILHLIQGFATGGLENVVLGLLRTMVGREPWHLELACLDNNMPRIGEVQQLGVPAHCLHRKPGVDWAVPWRLARILRGRRVDLLHCHNETGMFYGVPAALFVPRVHVVVTEHGRLFPGKWHAHRINRAFSARIDKMVTVSEDMARKVAQHDRIRRDKIRVIPNGVDLGLFTRARDRPRIRAAINLRLQDRVIGVVARLAPVKNHSALLHGFVDVRRAEPLARLLVVGDGPLRADLEREATTLGIAPYVKFLGDRQDVPDLLNAMDVFCLPSHSEGMSLTVLEAMASGLPVVATAVGGNTELIRDGITGRLVRPNDPRHLADGILGLLANPALAREMGAAARAWACRHFPSDRTTATYEALYNEVLGYPTQLRASAGMDPGNVACPDEGDGGT